MDQALLMRLVNGSRDLRYQLYTIPRWQAKRVTSCLQAAVRGKLHTKVRQAVVRCADVVDWKDVRMVEACGGGSFPAESRQGFLRVAVVAQHTLQSDDSTRREMPRPVNDTHATAADLFQHAVRPQLPVAIGDPDLANGRAKSLFAEFVRYRCVAQQAA